MFLFSDIWEETEGDQSDNDDKMKVMLMSYDYFSLFIKFRQKSIFSASFRHFVSFSSKTKSFGADE